MIMASMLNGLTICCKGHDGWTRFRADVATSCLAKARKVKGGNRVRSIRYP